MRSQGEYDSGESASDRLGLDRSTYWFLAVAAFTLFLAGSIGYSTIGRFEPFVARVVHTYEVISASQGVLVQAIDSEGIACQLELTTVASGQEGSCASWRGRAETALNALADLVKDNPGQTSRVASLTLLLGLAPVPRTAPIPGSSAAVAAARSLIDEMIDEERRLLIPRTERLPRTVSILRRAMGVFGGIATVILVAMIVRMRRDLNARVQAKRRVEQLNADLETRAGQLAQENAERRSAESAATRRNEELKGFAYTVSHDLKAPLRGITGYAQEMERRHKDALTERAAFCVSQIITASRNLDALIEDLLRYARVDAESWAMKEFVLGDLLARILQDRARTVEELSVVVRVEGADLRLQTWERGLHQILANLIDNALKYSRNSRPPQLTIEATEHDGVCQIQITDNGIGFDMKYHDRIFGLFNRLVRANEYEGTGAGLAIVKKLVDRIEGSIRAESSLGGGARFYVFVPKILQKVSDQAA